MSANLYTIAVLKAKTGKEQALIEVLQKLADETRKEDGAEEYGFIQDQKSPHVVLSYEKWRDADAEAAHWKTAHLKTAIAEFGDILDGQPLIYKGPKVI
ncbi:MAG: putative quinol monooxygenase [Filomicrobium sp.]